MKYDVTNLRPSILNFAMNSTNQSEYCVKCVNQMKFKSDEPSEHVDAKNSDIVKIPPRKLRSGTISIRSIILQLLHMEVVKIRRLLE